MRKYQKQTDLIKQNLIEGEIIEFNGKVCKVTIHRSGPLNNLKESIVFVPLPQVTVTEDTEVIFEK